jgi:tripeptide aminopeptidase
MTGITDQVVERFLNYVEIDTQSDDKSPTFPSTKNQFDLADCLVDELDALGLSDVSVDEYCQVRATLEGNLYNTKVPVIGLIAHMDTSPEVSGKDVKPQVRRNYRGGDIVLKGATIREKNNPELREYIGHDLITSDGTTLLGADDKAGIAEIMTAIQYLKEHPEIKHATLKIAFTPDEEVGKSTTHFDVKKFGAKYAYTVDGIELGEIEDETFNAAKAEFNILGVNAHPGYAKGKMINSQKILAKLIGMIPHEESPEMTEGDQGFYHILRTNGSVGESMIELIIRDFDYNNFEERKDRLVELKDQLLNLYRNIKVTLKIENQYMNMKEIMDKHPEVVEIAVEAIKRADVEPVHKKVRGGTDGARLSFMGLPTPNLFAGGLNFHSNIEYVPVYSMVKATEVLVIIPQIYVQRYHKG